MFPILVSWWNQWGWSSSPVQSLQLLGLKMNTSGKWWHLTHEPSVNLWVSYKLLCVPSVSKLINLIPSPHTRITSFNAYHIFRVSHVNGWNQTWKRRPSLPCREGRVIGWFSAKPTKLYAPPYLLEWLEERWLSSRRIHPTQSQWRE